MRIDIGTYHGKVRHCLASLLTLLPDRRVVRDDLVVQLTAACSFDGRLTEAQQLVADFVTAIPICYGVARRRRYWEILRLYFSDEEAVRLYLIRFPNAATAKQLASIRCYLVESIGFSTEMVDDLMSDRRFERIPNQVSRPRHKLRLTF